MRRLTPDEVSREVEKIRTRPWPYRLELMMKNLYDGTSLLDRSFGRILRTDATRPETIVPEILLADNKGRKTYPSLEAMVEAGWVVD